MNEHGASTWQIILSVAGVLLAIGLIVAGQLLFAGVIFVFLVILGGGALLYRTRGPAEP